MKIRFDNDGVEQARRAGKFYASLFAQANVRVFSSPTLRALQTSKEFIRNINVAAPVAVLDNLYERMDYHTRRNVRSKTKKNLNESFLIGFQLLARWTMVYTRSQRNKSRSCPEIPRYCTIG